MFCEVVQVIPYEDYTVYVYFEDGKVVCFDMKPLLDKPVFLPLKDREVFMKTCTIMNHTLAWDLSGKQDSTECIDIDPETLHDLEHVAERIA